jgi:hypothetical protein
MNEADLKSKLVKFLRKKIPSSVVFRHEDKLTGGVPDISVTYANTTTWIEAKFIRGRITFSDTGLQRISMQRLDYAGKRAFYVIWREDDFGEMETIVVYARDLTVFLATGSMAYIEEGISHELVLRRIRDGCRQS